MDNSSANGPVQNPTYMADIRQFFTDIDIAHMGPKGIDLSTYDGVKANAPTIYIHTRQPDGDMPPDPLPKWTADMSQTFLNWIMNGYPMGSAVAAEALMLKAAAPAVGRLRKNVSTLSPDEVAALTTAFKGLLAKDPADPGGYCALASIHGLPAPTYCLHHEPRFNPWHREYLRVFEDALRSVPGCADVTLPYWDMSMPVPALFKSPPFDSYVVPVNLGARYGTNYQTSRYDDAKIATLLKRYDFAGNTATSLQQSTFGHYGVDGYQDTSIAAHDGGHLAIGPTMADQNIASFDPIFWFFHCNLDRMWWKWQTLVSGTTLAGFKSTMSPSDQYWLSAPFSALPPSPPLTATADQTIAQTDIGYDTLDVAGAAGPALKFENKVGSLDAVRSFSIRSSAPVSVRVKDINRLNIPGSFQVDLLADGEPIATRAFFQPATPNDCANCRDHGLINVNFRVDQAEILDRKLTVEIHVPSQEEAGTEFPLSQAGNPTINARLLLQDE
jgi:hypothetical protein